jgi:uncharacterized protein
MYKLSKYNYFVPYSDRIIFFNGFSGQIFSTSEKEYLSIKELFGALDLFQTKYSSVFEKFKEWGFIINEQTDELDFIRLRNRRAVFADRVYHLTINPTLECNFNCWYCYIQHPKGYMSGAAIELVKKHIRWMVDNEKIDGLHLTWFGGEPLIYYNQVMQPISQYAMELMATRDLKFYHSIITSSRLLIQ